MSKRRAAALIAASLLALSPARADYSVTIAGGGNATFGSFDVGGIKFPKHAMVDPSTGAAIGVSGSPLFASITNFPASQAVTNAGTFPVQTTAVDGADVTQGAKADAAYAGSGSASIVALLKGIYSGLLAPLPAGQNVIGKADSVIPGTAANRGNTITTASTAQTFLAANASRRGFAIQNQSPGDLYVNCIGTATLDYNSLKVPAGSLYETPAQHVGTGACSIIGATAGQAFYGREY